MYDYLIHLIFANLINSANVTNSIQLLEKIRYKTQKAHREWAFLDLS